MRKMTKVIKIITIILLSISVISCAGNYGSSFGCSDARGMNCRMMNEVDKAIDSGEIEIVELKKCKGKKCTSRYIEDVKPELADKTQHNIRTYKLK